MSVVLLPPVEFQLLKSTDEENEKNGHRIYADIADPIAAAAGHGATSLLCQSCSILTNSYII